MPVNIWEMIDVVRKGLTSCIRHLYAGFRSMQPFLEMIRLDLVSGLQQIARQNVNMSQETNARPTCSNLLISSSDAIAASHSEFWCNNRQNDISTCLSASLP